MCVGSKIDISSHLVSSRSVSRPSYVQRMPYAHTSSQSETIGPVNFCWPWVCVSEMFGRATIRVLRTCLNIFIGYAHSDCLRFKGRPTTKGATTIATTTAAAATTKSSTNIWKFKFGIEKQTNAFMCFSIGILCLKYASVSQWAALALAQPNTNQCVCIGICVCVSKQNNESTPNYLIDQIIVLATWQLTYLHFVIT